MAGESAREIARRRRDKATRLLEVADAYEKGAEGEQRTAAALAMLPASGWFVLHDVRWPGRRFANIDHVVIGPGGVFVIDSKAWSGRVEVRDDVLRQNGYRRDEAVAGAADAASAVAECAPGLRASAATPVLCFTDSHELADWVGEVMVTTPHNLVAMLLSRPVVLDGRAVRRMLLTLQQALESAQSAPSPRVSGGRRPSGARGRKASASRPASRRTKSVGRGLLPGALCLAVAVAASVGLARYADEIASWITHIASPSSGSGHGERLGTAERAPSGAGRPPLRVTAVRAGTVHRIGHEPSQLPGDRFFGVCVLIHNLGLKPWVSQPGTTYAVTDSLGITHSSFSMPRLREGKTLGDALRVPPGGTVQGYVTFQLDSSTPVTEFSMTLGPGKEHTLSWAIPRQ